jgi:flavodoxin
MQTLVVFDSQFGNTERVAQTIAQALGESTRVTVLHAAEATTVDFSDVALLIVGSPTQRFNPTQTTTQFLKEIPSGALEGVHAAAFDTRFTVEMIEGIRVLAFFVRIFGYAAAPIAKQLEAKGALLAVPPEGFYVKDTEGPLLEEELERARSWAKMILGILTNQ